MACSAQSDAGELNRFEMGGAAGRGSALFVLIRVGQTSRSVLLLVFS